ncbi:hypothetical protein [Paraburkholderia sp. J12]|uniref:hypothetical protein n=1 Tax=Paraburkholderia sp. J12 TaxID=2805432 RepID=UPI002ABDEA6A|nr:hypothetical protein [Paraburkholderia sp. J12]
MTTNANSPMPDPSEYIAQHLKSFANPAPAAAQHPGFFVYPPGLALVVVLFVVLVGVAIFTDRRPPFRIGRSMTFGQRLSLWWSCAWRQWLASTFVFAVCFIAFHFLVRSSGSLWNLESDLAAPRPLWSAPGWSFLFPFAPLLASTLIYVLLILPLVGYMVKSGLVAHAMPRPERFGMAEATLMGLTTYAWSIPGSLLIAYVGWSLPYHAQGAIHAVWFVAWGMYIVLPRQVRRIVRLAGH